MVRATSSLAILALALAGVALFAMGAGSIEAAGDPSQFDRATLDAAKGTSNWTEGEGIYVATCDTCHGAGGPGAPSFKTVPLENATGTGEAAQAQPLRRSPMRLPTRQG
jgi:cytochrome c5